MDDIKSLHFNKKHLSPIPLRQPLTKHELLIGKRWVKVATDAHGHNTDVYKDLKGGCHA